MLETPHVIVGAAIAARIANPAISLPLVLASHFVLDKVPHWNPHLGTEMKKYGKVKSSSKNIIIVDIMASLFFGTIIASSALPNITHATTILLACFVSVLPDIIEGPYFFLNFKSKLIKRWIDFQRSIQVNTSVVPGLLTQIIIIIAAFWWILT